MAFSVCSAPLARPSDMDLATLEQTLTSAIDSFQEDPASLQKRESLLEAIRAFAIAVRALPKHRHDDPLVSVALAAVPRIQKCGVYGDLAGGHDRELLAGGNDWQTIIATMLLLAPWNAPGAPGLEKVPHWLWGAYVAWIFTPPEGFQFVGEADRYAAFQLARLEELAKLVERNLGSSVVREAADVYLSAGSGIPLYFARCSLRPHAEARGRILKRLFRERAAFPEPLAFPRAGRRLRVGFLNRHFGPQTETYTTLPTFEYLDPERFEVLLYSLQNTDSELAGYCRGRAAGFHVLPGDVEEQLNVLRAANLDVLVFGTNVTAVTHDVARLALYRIAPLQVVNNSSCITSGFSEMDLYVSGDLTETAGATTQFSERLGLLPGPAHAFNYNADRTDATTTWTREALGLPADAVVFVTAANYFKIIPEMQECWARLLARVPNARLLVHPFNPNWSSNYPIKRFCAEFDAVLARHGVATDRLVVSTAKFPSRTDVRELLAVGDVYLDTFPFGGVNSLVDPLEAGIPVVVWEGDSFRSRMGAALARSLGLPEVIATDEDGYLGIAEGLGRDREQRVRLQEKIRAAMEAGPVFLDPLAASDAFGDLLELAFDELERVGREAFRKDRAALHAPSVAVGGDADFDLLAAARNQLRRGPADPTARRAYGNALLRAGNAERAAEYLVAAIQNNEADASLWYELAVALRRAGRVREAIQAVEASLRLDPSKADAWTMVAELAEAAGLHDMAAEAKGVLAELAQQPAATDPLPA